MNLFPQKLSFGEEGGWFSEFLQELKICLSVAFRCVKANARGTEMLPMRRVQLHCQYGLW